MMETASYDFCQKKISRSLYGFTVVAITLAVMLSIPGNAILMSAEETVKSGARTSEISTLPPTESAGFLALHGTITPHSIHGMAGPDLVIRTHGILYIAPGSILIAGDGTKGTSAIGAYHQQGGLGTDGGNVILKAPLIIAHQAIIASGNGGPGGDAIATGAPGAIAYGGPGGEAGRIEIMGELVGLATFIHGSGGPGGNAHATGSNGNECSDEPGESHIIDHRDDTLIPLRGDGEEANAMGADGDCAPPDGAGGHGGHAKAYGGHGGVSQDGQGGDGGNAVAFGGDGGDGQDACFPTLRRAEESGYSWAGPGGHAGDAIAIGGNGGFGQPQGNGGNAQAITGTGGDGGDGTIRYNKSDPEADPEFVIHNGDFGWAGISNATGGDGRNGGSATASTLSAGRTGNYCVLGPFASLPTAAPMLLMLVLLVSLAMARRTKRR
jgi:hypothetical protein